MPPALLATLVYAVVFVFLFGPVWTGSGTLVHGDALSVGLPLKTLFAEAIAEGRFPLWSSDLYGGHPIFAEGQGAFAHPLTWLLFGPLPVPVAHGILPPICLFGAALGTFALCRRLGLGAPACLAGGLLLGCSQAWLDLGGNGTIALAAAGTPWVLVALERWWRAPSLGSALVLGGAVALVALAGYPQAVHAVAIFAAVVLGVRCADRSWLGAPGLHLATAPAAVLAALSLAAVQLLPTWELAALSVRSEGIELAQAFEPSWHLRGWLFAAGHRGAEVVPGLGSPLGVALAAVGLLLRPGRDVVAYGLASLLLALLAMGDATPVHAALRGLLPGLELFRITWLYGTVGVIGLAVLAAIGIERLASATRGEWLRAGAAAAAVALLAGLLVGEHVGVGSLLALPAAALLVAGLVGSGRQPLVAGALAAVVALAGVAAGSSLLGFAPRSLVETPPATAARIAAAPGPPGRIANVPHHFTYLGFSPASAPDLAALVPLFLASLDANSNLLWGLPSIHANLALPLSRRQAIDGVLEAELRGRSPRRPGRRLVDQLGIRWLVVHHGHRDGAYAPDLVEVFFDDATRFHLLENPSAGPRLRFHTRAVPVADAAAALALFERARGGVLAVEGLPAGAGAAAPLGAAAEVAIETLSSSPERHVLRVDAPLAGWLFFAEAPYPGWRAWLDGEPATLHPANVLGQALRLPAGRHDIEIAFEPRSVRTGLAISLGALAVLLLLLVFEGRR